MSLELRALHWPTLNEPLPQVPVGVPKEAKSTLEKVAPVGHANCAVLPSPTPATHVLAPEVAFAFAQAHVKRPLYDAYEPSTKGTSAWSVTRGNSVGRVKAAPLGAGIRPPRCENRKPPGEENWRERGAEGRGRGVRREKVGR
jgi:hypothetical protein